LRRLVVTNLTHILNFSTRNIKRGSRKDTTAGSRHWAR